MTITRGVTEHRGTPRLKRSGLRQSFDVAAMRKHSEVHAVHLSVVKMYVYSRYLLGSRLVFAEYLRQVLQAGRSVLSHPSAVGE